MRADLGVVLFLNTLFLHKLGNKILHIVGSFIFEAINNYRDGLVEILISK